MKAQVLEKEKRKKRNRLIGIVLVVSIIVLFVFSMNPFAIYEPGNGGTGIVDYVPSTEYGVGIPILDEISPEVDYDGNINLKWSLETAYTITKFYIFKRFASGSWILIAVLETTYSYKPKCYAEGIYGFRVMGVATINGEEHNSQYSSEQSVRVSYEAESIPYLKAIESPNNDGIIDLDWNDVAGPLGGSVSGYRIYGQFAFGGWRLVEEVSKGITDYTNNVGTNGEYQYYVRSVTYYLGIEMEGGSSNVQSVVVNINGDGDDNGDDDPDPVPDPVPPTNPTISINDGDATTDSLTITLTLSCDSATKMQFEIYGNLLNFIAYSETYEIEFLQEGLDYPNYKVGVIFGNDDGETEIIYDEITYEEPEEEEEEEEEEEPISNGEEETNYTLVYVLLAILGGVIGVVVFVKYRKPKKSERR